jgi:chromate transporter
MTLYVLFFMFVQIGLFTIGGGLATLPLLKEAAVDGGFLSLGEFIDMVAISQSTPGPIGVNLATIVGYRLEGILGGVIATVGIIAPSLLISMVIARWMRNYADHPTVQSIMTGIRACALGLIASAAWFILREAVFTGDSRGATGLEWLVALTDIRALVLFVLMGAVYVVKPAWPVVYIVVGGVLGVLFL